MSHHRPAKFAWVALAFLATAIPASAQEIRWRTDYNIAWREALEGGRPLFVNIGSENCIWCRRLEQFSFRDPTVIKLLNEQFIPVKLDGGKNPNFVRSLNIHAYPAMVFGTADGKLLGCFEGYVDADDFRRKCQAALSQMPPRPVVVKTKSAWAALDQDVKALTMILTSIGKRINPNRILDVVNAIGTKDTTKVQSSLVRVFDVTADLKTTVVRPDE